MPGSNDTLRIASQFDIGPITSGMNESAAAVEAGAARMKASFGEVAVASEFSATEARHALHGLGEEIGIHVPRFVQSFVAQLGGVGPVLSAAFAPIAVIGLVGVLGEIPDAIEKGINKLQGWNDEARKTFRESTIEAIDFEKHTIKLNEEIAKIALIGLKGPEKYALELRIAASTTKELTALQDEYKQKIEGTKTASETLSKETSLGGMNAWKNLMQGGAAAVFMASQMAASGKIIEQNKIQTEEWSKELKKVNEEIEHRQKVEMPTISAEGVVAKKEAEERAAKEAQEAWHRTVIAELDDAERLAKEKIRVMAETAHENAEFNKNYAADIKRMDAEIERSKNKSLALAVETQNKELREEERIAKLREKPWNELFSVTNRGVDQMVKGIITGSRSAGQVVARMGTDILTSTASWLANAALKHAEHYALVNLIEKSAMAQSLTNFITGTTAKKAAQSASAVGEITSDAGVGAAAAFASVMAGLPFPANIAAAPGIAAATLSAIEAFAGLAAFAKGGIVPSTGPAVLHAGEMVLPAHISQAVQRATSQPGGMSGGHTFNYTYQGSGSRAEGKQSHKDFMKFAMRELRRRGISGS